MNTTTRYVIKNNQNEYRTYGDRYGHSGQRWTSNFDKARIFLRKCDAKNAMTKKEKETCTVSPVRVVD